MAILQDLLLSSFVRDVISRVKTPTRYLSRSLGWGWDGAGIGNVKSTETISGRVYTYDIFDNVRTLANARLPGAPSGTVAANPVGNNTVGLARFAEKLPLDYNQLSQIRVLGKGASDKDRAGASYINAQVRFLRQRADNVWEFLAGALFRGGKYFFFQSGDDLIPSYRSAGTFFGVDLKVDAGNIGANLAGLQPAQAFAAGLQMGTGANIIDAAWDNVATHIPSHIAQINSAFQDIVGAPLARIYCGSDVWLNVLANTDVRNLAGSANEPFARFEQVPEMDQNGTPTGLMIGRIRGWPWIDWYIWDGSLRVATAASTFADVKMLPRGCVTFMIDPDGTWLKGIVGSEIVKDNDWTEPVERFGLYTWAMEKADPAKVWYHTLQNVGVELNVPKGIATTRVMTTTTDN